MNGHELPRRFPLISLHDPSHVEPQTEQDTVVEGEPILRVRNLVTRFPLRSGILNRVTREVHAVENVSFDLWPGETLSLVGESGCGKSTTGRALLRLVESQRGEIIFNGQRIDTLAASKLQPLRRDIQFIFQIRMPRSIRARPWDIPFWSRYGYMGYCRVMRDQNGLHGCWNV